jgi:hypothetical protein
MNDTLKTILWVSVSAVLILSVFLGGFLLGRFSSPFQGPAMHHSMGWPMSSAETCPYNQLPYQHQPGSGMFDRHHPGGSFYHHEGMDFWDLRDR